MRAYIETTILSDWFFVQTMLPSSRKRLRRSVRSSHRLVEGILELKSQTDSFVTSNWAVLEAVGSVKRSRVQFNMLMQNINFGYNDDVKDKKNFRLTETQIAEIRRLIGLLRRTHGKLLLSNIQWSRVPIIFEDVMSFIILGLDAPDALHTGIARAEDCNIFITRDGDFIKRKKTLRPFFEVLEPLEAVERIEISSRPKVTLTYIGA